MTRMQACSYLVASELLLALTGCGPTIHRLDARPKYVCPGSSTTVHWEAKATEVSLSSDNSMMDQPGRVEPVGEKTVKIDRDVTFTVTAKKNCKVKSKDARAIAIGKSEFRDNYLAGAYHDLVGLVVRNPKCVQASRNMELAGTASLPPELVQKAVMVKSVGRLPLEELWKGTGEAFESLTWKRLLGFGSKCERRRRPIHIRHEGMEAVLSPGAETSTVFAGQDLGGEWEIAAILQPGERCPCDDSIDLVIELKCP